MKELKFITVVLVGALVGTTVDSLMGIVWLSSMTHFVHIVVYTLWGAVIGRTAWFL